MKLPLNPEQLSKHKRLLSKMDAERRPWFNLWRTVAEQFLPRRYPYLTPRSKNTTSPAALLTSKIINPTPTLAVRTLASGMMNGVTSPSRPWLSLGIAGTSMEELSHEAKLWLVEVERRFFEILASSNFYTAIATLYLEWCTFGTAVMVIYEDFEEVIRCYNFAVGEFFLSQSSGQRVNRIARQFSKHIEDIVSDFGEENLSIKSKELYRQGGDKLLELIACEHIIEPNDPEDGLLSVPAPYREVYWETGGDSGQYLAVRPLYEWPALVARWELHSQDTYASSPAIDALGDAIELQQTAKDQAQGRAKTVRPPLIVDMLLQNRPKALGAGGLTYASAANSNFGAKKAYEINFPFQENQIHTQALEARIRETCHNQLFNMISQLDTVRSATEIDARREEKLVHLGPVYERLGNEGLDEVVKRVFNIMERNGLIPEPPEELTEQNIQVRYISVLADAQRAVSTVAIERWLTFGANLAGVYPTAQKVPNVEELMREYAEGIGIKPQGIRSREEIAEAEAAENEANSLAQTAAIGKDFAQGAEAASNVDVGGGQNAIEALL